MADQRLCYICGPRYAANASLQNGAIPICTVCSWDLKILTDQELETQRLAEEASRQSQFELQTGTGWGTVTPQPFSLDDIPF